MPPATASTRSPGCAARAAWAARARTPGARGRAQLDLFVLVEHQRELGHVREVIDLARLTLAWLSTTVLRASAAQVEADPSLRVVFGAEPRCLQAVAACALFQPCCDESALDLDLAQLVDRVAAY